MISLVASQRTICSVANGVLFAFATAMGVVTATEPWQPIVSDERDEYQASIEAWREESERKLASPTGWLALIAHVWLEKGENRIGTEPDDAIQLPRELGETCRGVIEREADQRVYLVSEEGAPFRVHGQWEPRIELKIEPGTSEADSPDLVILGDRIQLQLVRRSGKLAIRVRDSQSERIKFFGGKKWFPIYPRYRVEARWTPIDPPESLRIVNIRGDEVDVQVVGQIHFEFDGREHELLAMLDSPDELFIVFKDSTSGRSTYGPGRFLTVPRPQKDARLILDFNKAYNPPCAFSPFTLCPLPPRENRLPFAIEAGERFDNR